MEADSFDHQSKTKVDNASYLVNVGNFRNAAPSPTIAFLLSTSILSLLKELDAVDTYLLHLGTQKRKAKDLICPIFGEDGICTVTVNKRMRKSPKQVQLMNYMILVMMDRHI